MKLFDLFQIIYQGNLAFIWSTELGDILSVESEYGGNFEEEESQRRASRIRDEGYRTNRGEQG